MPALRVLPWAEVARLAYFAALGIAPLGILHRTRWPLALGFSAWAWGFLYLTSTYQTPEFVRLLPTTRILNWAYPALIRDARQPGAARQTIRLDGVVLEGNLEIGEYRGAVTICNAGTSSPVVEGPAWPT